VLFRSKPIVPIQDTRTICVADQLHKLIEKIIRSRIKWNDLHLHNAGKQGLLDTWWIQTGFTEKVGCEWNTKKMLSWIHETKRNRTPAAIMFVDITKAYDSVNLNTLFTILRQRAKATNVQDLETLVERMINMMNRNILVIGDQKIAVG
jgi:hypothetical protein